MNFGLRPIMLRPKQLGICFEFAHTPTDIVPGGTLAAIF